MILGEFPGCFLYFPVPGGFKLDCAILFFFKKLGFFYDMAEIFTFFS